MIYWASLLHFYQPPVQIHAVLRRVVEESYRPLIELLRQFPYARLTVNINGVLTEMLAEHGFDDVIAGLRELAQRGQIEFTGSAKYHAILPLVPRSEALRQVRRNYLTNRHFFGDTYRPQGFFPPEMCYSRDIVGPIVETGHRWLIVSGIACPVEWPMDVVHQVPWADEGLAVFFRDDILSNKIAFQSVDGKGFIEHLRALRKGRPGDIYVITAMDAETFGHHIQGWEELFLADVYEQIGNGTLPSPAGPAQQQVVAQQHRGILTYEPESAEDEIRAVTISELLDRFPPGAPISPRASSWSTTAAELAAGEPFPLWKHSGNPVHRLQWEHTAITLELVHRALEVADNEASQGFARIARALLDPALHSCQYWWASRRPHWDINMVHRGLLGQQEATLNAFKAIESSGADAEVKRRSYHLVTAARDAYAKITDQLFNT